MVHKHDAGREQVTHEIFGCGERALRGNVVYAHFTSESFCDVSFKSDFLIFSILLLLGQFLGLFFTNVVNFVFDLVTLFNGRALGSSLAVNPEVGRSEVLLRPCEECFGCSLRISVENVAELLARTFI